MHAGLWAGTEAESSDSDQKLAELSASVARKLSLRSEYQSWEWGNRQKGRDQCQTQGET